MNYSNTSLRTGNITSEHSRELTSLETTSIALTLCAFMFCMFYLIKTKKK